MVHELTTREQQTKVTNDGTNTRRQGRIAFAAAAMARQERQEAARKAKLQAKLVAWREERALLPPPFLKRKRDEGVGKLPRRVRLLPASGDSIFLHPYNTAAPESGSD